jgi:hypothetical protein
MTEPLRTQRETLDLIVTILAPDGVNSWIANVELRHAGRSVVYDGVYLEGATEDEAIMNVARSVKMRDAKGQLIDLSIGPIRDMPDDDVSGDDGDNPSQ